MGLKVCFYSSVMNNEDKEKNSLECSCIYSIRAGEICSEFIARYFYKPKDVPNNLINKLIEEKYEKEDYKNAKKDISTGIYQVKIDKMTQDDKERFELKTFEESKLVREKLIEKYTNINNGLKGNELEIYALLTV